MVYSSVISDADWLEVFYYGVPIMLVVIIIMLGVIIGIIKNRE